MSLVFEAGDRPQISAKALCDGLERIYKSDSWTVQMLTDTPGFLLGMAKPPYYPLSVYETDTLFICMEGRIYGQSEDVTRRTLIELAETVAADWEGCKNILRPWVLETDGQFIVIIRHKPSGRVILFNDLLGQLGLYYNTSAGRAVFSRDLRFVCEVAACDEFDRQAMWQFMLFLYCLEYRTLVKDVFRLPAAGIVMMDKDGEIRKDTLYTFNFQHREHAGKSLDANAERLADLFTAACQRRAASANGTMVLLLSGGLDSRLIAGALSSAGIPFETTSYLDWGGRARVDADIAGEVAQTLGVKHRLYELSAGNGATVLEVLKIKHGQVNLGIPHAMQYYRRLYDSYQGRLTGWGGSGGDLAVADQRPPYKMRTLNSFVSYLLRFNQLFPAGRIAEMMRIDEKEIFLTMKRIVSAFPERSLDQKYTHYIICERGFARFLEGDERMRFLFDVMAPFWSPDVFFYAMNCPDEQKHASMLRARMLEKLDGRLAEIPRVMYERRVPLVTPEQCRKSLSERMRQWPNPVRFAVKTLRGRAQVPQRETGRAPAKAIIDCLRAQSRNCATIGEYFSIKGVNSLLDDLPNCGREAVAGLLTVFSTMEFLSEKRSTLEDYADAVVDAWVCDIRATSTAKMDPGEVK